MESKGNPFTSFSTVQKPCRNANERHEFECHKLKRLSANPISFSFLFPLQCFALDLCRK